MLKRRESARERSARERRTQLEQARARVAETAATEFMSLWGEPAKLPPSALPVLPQPRAQRAPKPKIVGNPCVALYGAGPALKRCKTCAHLFAHRQSRTWYKCDLRTFTHGPGSDHRVNWPACAKYEARATHD